MSWFPISRVEYSLVGSVNAPSAIPQRRSPLRKPHPGVASNSHPVNMKQIPAALEVLWTPPEPRSTVMWRFMERVNGKYGLDIVDYPGLYQWSIQNVASFWEEVWLFFNIRASRDFDKV